MADFNAQCDRMKYLMNYGKTINESENPVVASTIEYTTNGPDNKVYGIIKENSKYYIKTAEPGKEKLTEDFDYIGGFCNRKCNEYHSYPLALKQLELKMMSLNEAYEGKAKTEMLDPMAKEDVRLNETAQMSEALKAHKRILENASRIALGEEVKMTTEDPEKPSSNGTQCECAPFTEKGEAKLDVDLKATAENPEAQSEPFEEKAEAKLDKDMKETASNPEAQSEPFEKKATVKEGTGNAEAQSEPFEEKAKIEEGKCCGKCKEGHCVCKDGKCTCGQMNGEKETPKVMNEEDNEESPQPIAKDEDNGNGSNKLGNVVESKAKKIAMARLQQIIKEEVTNLNVFGDHPGYRKKPMTLPSNSHQEKEGYKDWNDDSVKGEMPFGTKIGSSAPYDKVVSMIVDAIKKELPMALKKK